MTKSANRLARAAYRRGREMLWPRVVERSLEPLAEETPDRRSPAAAALLRPAARRDRSG